MSAKPILFIDANQYLDLYRMVRGKKLLAALEEQKDYVFVTAQIANETSRNTVKVAASFLADTIKKMALNVPALPDHLPSSMDAKLEELAFRLHDIQEEGLKVVEEFSALTHDLLEQVSKSEDEVSKALAVIFSAAVRPNDEELSRARQRKAHGNPPGKPNDPLGDQLTWEQLLAKCKDKPDIWIITRDSDFATKHQGKMFLNALLYRELISIYDAPPVVFCFDTLAEGLKHFSENASVNAKESLTPDETEKTKKEQESLPPLGWLTDPTDALSTAILGANINNMYINPGLANTFASLQTSGAFNTQPFASLKTPQFYSDFASLRETFGKVPSLGTAYSTLLKEVNVPSLRTMFSGLADMPTLQQSAQAPPQPAHASPDKVTTVQEDDSSKESKEKKDGE